MVSRQQLLKQTIKSAEQIGREFTEPDDDWTSVMLVVPAGGQTIIPQLLHFANDEEKTQILENLPEIIANQQADQVALVLSSWMSTINIEDLPPPAVLRAPSNDPGRTECLIVTVSDLAGTEMSMAEIKRFPDRPPKLGPWGSLDSYESQWTEVINKGLMASQARRS